MNTFVHKMKNFITKIGKQNFILFIFILFVIILTGIYQTFSLYTGSEGLSIVDGMKTYKFILGNNDENSITIASGASKHIAITVSNAQEIALQYGIYYTSSDDLTDIDLGYKIDTEYLPNGLIEAGKDYIINIQIDNDSDSNVTITFGVKYGLENGGDLTLDTGEYWLEQKAILLSEVKVGSYVAYTGDFGCEGDSCSGVNANSSDTSNGYCADSRYEYDSSGWRVAYIEDDNAHIISAGAVECICTNSDGTTSSSSCSDYDTTEGNTLHIANLNSVALKYCNSDYAEFGMCNSSTAWALNGENFKKVTSSAISSCYSVSSNSCGLSNSLINNGGYYWYATPNSWDGYTAFLWYPWPTYLFVGQDHSNYPFGVRPIIKLDSDIIVTGGSGTENDPYIIESTFPNSLKAFNSNEETTYFHNATYREYIKNISFVDYIDTTNAVESWDMSTYEDGSIMAWVNNNTTSGYYDLYIGSEEPIKAVSLAYYFSNMTNVDSIHFSNLDTSVTKNMKNMFDSTGYNSSIFTLDLGETFNTSKVTNMSGMFAYAGHSNETFTLDLGDKFDTSNVTDMYGMFRETGHSSTEFTLDLGDKFNTSKVTSMYVMFYQTGYSSTVFTLDLGDKFDTSNVTDMRHMFDAIGYNSTVFTLDLGDKFDTSNVTNMTHMFNGVGRSSTVFVLNLGANFNTSKVIDMSAMFSYVGYSNTTFTLDLGNNFNTSKVTNMDYMFQNIGYSSTSFTLDLGDEFNTSNVISMARMFYNTGYSSTVFTLDLGNHFDTSKVTNTERMFYQVGNANLSLELDLSSFTFEQITTYTNMFFNYRATQKIYVKNTSDQTWILNLGHSGLSTSNVLVKS